eukprot:1152401-Pelagomonas_calceolata.AAC.1
MPPKTPPPLSTELAAQHGRAGSMGHSVAGRASQVPLVPSPQLEGAPAEVGSLLRTEAESDREDQTLAGVRGKGNRHEGRNANSASHSSCRSTNRSSIYDS